MPYRRLGNTWSCFRHMRAQLCAWVARSFFIPVVHNPLGPCGTWQHRSSHLGEVRSGPRGSVGAHIGRETRSGAEEHVAAPELSSQGDRARSHGTRGSAGGAKKCAAASELNSARRWGPEPRDMWQLRSPPLQGGVVRSYSLCGSAWMHTLLLVLT
jgi:hypothetical protein